MAYFSISNGPQDDDSQSGSNSPSPTGITTPHPDPSDKRLPSLMPSYLQVGLPLDARLSPPTARLLPSEPPSARNMQPKALVTGTRDDQSSGHTSSPSGSFVMMERNDALGATSSPAPSDKKFDDAEELAPDALPPTTNLPTPPYCSACSLLQKEPDQQDSESSLADKGVGSIFNTLKNYLTPATSTPPSSEPQSRHRQHSLPVSSISDDPVLASHFSNPSLLSASDALCLPEAPLLNHEQPHVSLSSENLAKLTGNVSDLSIMKNTPPLTPRAMSNEGSQPEKQPPPTSSPHPSEPVRTSSNEMHDDNSTSTDEISGKLNEAFPPEPSSSPQPGPPVASQKGKLYVKISEARGLRPGFDPYVVCVFEWNEVISKSAQDEEEASLERQHQEQERTARESGRPMAIPMKSRQSSNNSSMEAPDHRGRAPVTAPHWNHESVLYVLHGSASSPCYSVTNLGFPSRLVMCLVTSPRSMSPCTIATTRKLSLVMSVCVSISRKKTADWKGGSHCPAAVQAMLRCPEKSTWRCGLNRQRRSRWDRTISKS